MNSLRSNKSWFQMTICTYFTPEISCNTIQILFPSSAFAVYVSLPVTSQFGRAFHSVPMKIPNVILNAPLFNIFPADFHTRYSLSGGKNIVATISQMRKAFTPTKLKHSDFKNTLSSSSSLPHVQQQRFPASGDD